MEYAVVTGIYLKGYKAAEKKLQAMPPASATTEETP